MPPKHLKLSPVILATLVSPLKVDCFLPSLVPRPTARIPSMSTCPSSSTDTAISHYKIRPYNPHGDRLALEQICANVYDGKDYLPQMAESYAADPLCSFLALTAAKVDDDGDENNEAVLAVANYKRLPSQKCAWIEAVRTHPLHRKKGFASLLLREFIHLAMAENANHRTTQTVLTCTIQSNAAMQRALQNVGFRRHRTIHTLSFETLKQLPGWSSDCPAPPQPLLTALDLHRAISPAARTLASSSQWIPLTTDDELLSALSTLRRRGNTSGYLPGLYEYMIPSPSRTELQRSMARGLVATLRNEVVLALVRDERISTLKSKWVCSVAAFTSVGLEAAVSWAHSREAAKRMRGLDDDDGMENGVRGEEEDVTAVPFCLVFDDAVPLEEGTLAYSLPRVADECWVYSYECEG